MYRVLLIEHSHTQRFALAQTLHEAGYDPVECKDYWEAVTLLRDVAEVPWDAVVLGLVDYEPELLALLQSMLDRPPLKRLPLLLLGDAPGAELAAWLQRRPRARHLAHAQHLELLEFLDRLRLPAPAGGRGAAGGGRGRVLLLEDSPLDCERYARILGSAGYEVTLVHHVDGAQAAVASQEFDIVIVDYHLVQTGGAARLFASLSDNPCCGRLRPVMLISDYNDKWVQHSLELGAVECLFKTETDALIVARVNALARLLALQKTADAERRRFEAILTSIGEGVFGVDNEGRITFLNPAGARMLGFRRSEEYLGKLASRLIHIHDGKRKADQGARDRLAEAYANGTELTHWETVFSRVGGQKFHVVCTVQPLRFNDRRQGSVVAFRDITERKRLERRLIWQASRDPLTDLYNRRFFEKALKREVEKINRLPELRSALLYIDLDQFKYLNDTAGHDAGDKLLVEASQRLRECVRNSDAVARLGGDEFAVVLREVQEGEAVTIAEHLRSMLQEVAYISEEVSFKLSCSIGIAMIEPGLTDKDVLANADIACNIAKRKGRNQCHLYSEQTDADKASMNEEIAWSARLSEAVERQQFTLMYQPILPLDQVDFSALPEEPNRLWASLAHMPDHYEVLVRMRHDDGDMVSPLAFLPMAERFNLMQKIDLWVVREALRHLQALHREGRRASFSVNLSGSTLNSPDALRQIDHYLNQARIPPGSMVFEITETSAIEKMDVARNFIQALRKRHWRFALDDFGTGFSSFSQLKHLPVDIVKIDGQFVQDLATDPINQNIVIAINEIAHLHGMETVAEYVENADTLKLLRECKVDHAQGYYISRPLTNIDRRAETETQMLRLAEPVARH